MRIRLAWTDEDEDHILRHGIDRVEVEAVLRSRYYLRRRGLRFVLIGSSGHRVFLVVVEPSDQLRDAHRVVTARVAKPVEKRLFERRGKGRQ